MNKAFWSHLKHFGRLLGKKLSVPHSQQDWWKSSQPARCTYNLQPDYWEVSQQTYVQTLLASLGVIIEQNSDLRCGGREGELSQQKFAWRTNILRNRSIWCPWFILAFLCWLIFTGFFFALGGCFDKYGYCSVFVSTPADKELYCISGTNFISRANFVEFSQFGCKASCGNC